MNLTILDPYKIDSNLIEQPVHSFAGIPIEQTLKLKFADKDEADAKLLEAGVIEVSNDETQTNVTAIVYIGQIVDVPATFDEQGNELTPSQYKEGYHIDILI